MLLIKVIIIAFVYGVILTDSNMIFGPVYRYFEMKYGNIDQDWRFKFWLSCEKCIAGQIALWVYLWCNISDYSLIDHAAFICSAILGTILLKKIYERIN